MYTESILSVLAIRYEEMNAPPLTTLPCICSTMQVARYVQVFNLFQNPFVVRCRRESQCIYVLLMVCLTVMRYFCERKLSHFGVEIWFGR